jgi:phosphatidylcholine synthase
MASFGGRVGAAAVHVFTAMGVVCALLAMRAAIELRFPDVFFWLGVAFLIDGIDGTFARMMDVSRRLPRFSGEQLDLVIDYVTYVFVPVLALLQAGYLVGTFGWLLAAGILLSSLFHFSDTESKSDDNCFVGFPAIWNIVAFYFFAFNSPGWLVTLFVVGCIALTFVPWRWVHPMRVVKLRALTLALTVVWFIAALRAVWTGFPADWPTQVILGLVGIYGVGLAVQWREAPETTQ